jgi:hypothetical protein
MLSESERRTLDEIEHRLREEEPALAGALVTGRTNRIRLGIALAVVFGAIGFFLLFMGSLGDALTCFGWASLALLLRGFTLR